MKIFDTPNLQDPDLPTQFWYEASIHVSSKHGKTVKKRKTFSVEKNTPLEMVRDYAAGLVGQHMGDGDTATVRIWVKMTTANYELLVDIDTGLAYLTHKHETTAHILCEKWLALLSADQHARAVAGNLSAYAEGFDALEFLSDMLTLMQNDNAMTMRDIEPLIAMIPKSYRPDIIDLCWDSVPALNYLGRDLIKKFSPQRADRAVHLAKKYRAAMNAGVIRNG